MAHRASAPASLPTSPRRLLWRFVAVPFEARTYRSLAYLAPAFPLGIAYVVSVSVTFGLGLGLSVIGVGVPVVLLAVYATREVAAFERFAADRLTPVDVPAGTDAPPLSDPLAHVKHALTDLRTWTGVGYLLTKLAVGVGAFTLFVGGGATAGALLAAPLYYRERRLTVEPLGLGGTQFSPTVEFALQTWEVALTVPFEVAAWHVTTLPGALVVSATGVVAVLVVLHLVNAVAWVAGWHARLLLAGTDRSELRRLLETV